MIGKVLLYKVALIFFYIESSHLSCNLQGFYKAMCFFLDGVFIQLILRFDILIYDLISIIYGKRPEVRQTSVSSLQGHS
jgi:hypothetical protein